MTFLCPTLLVSPRFLTMENTISSLPSLRLGSRIFYVGFQYLLIRIQNFGVVP